MSINKKYVLAGVVASSIMLHTGISTVFADTEYRVITGDSVNFRSGAGTNYSSIGKLNKGDKIEYLGESGSWVKARYSGKTGYVYGSYVGEYTSTNTKYVTATTLNVPLKRLITNVVRASPSTSSAIIRSFAPL